MNACSAIDIVINVEVAVILGALTIAVVAVVGFSIASYIKDEYFK